MKRWLLTLEGFRYQPKIYAETAEKAAKSLKLSHIRTLLLWIQYPK